MKYQIETELLQMVQDRLCARGDFDMASQVREVIRGLVPAHSPYEATMRVEQAEATARNAPPAADRPTAEEENAVTRLTRKYNMICSAIDVHSAHLKKLDAAMENHRECIREASATLKEIRDAAQLGGPIKSLFTVMFDEHGKARIEQEPPSSTAEVDQTPPTPPQPRPTAPQEDDMLHRARMHCDSHRGACTIPPVEEMMSDFARSEVAAALDRQAKEHEKALLRARIEELEHWRAHSLLAFGHDPNDAIARISNYRSQLT